MQTEVNELIVIPQGLSRCHCRDDADTSDEVSHRCPEGRHISI